MILQAFTKERNFASAIVPQQICNKKQIYTDF